VSKKRKNDAINERKWAEEMKSFGDGSNAMYVHTFTLEWVL
jgi:hypothetical protein